MSPDRQIRGGKAKAINNIYTAVLAVALGIVLATAALVAYRCYLHYDTIFKIP